MSLGIIELLTRVGEDHVRVQNVIESATDFTVRGKGRNRATAITFLTNAMTPGDALHGAPVVGLVLWLPRKLVEQASAAHDAETGTGAPREPAAGGPGDPQ